MIDILEKKADLFLRATEASSVASVAFGDRLDVHNRGILKKCVNSQAVYPLSEQHGLKARERRYTAHEEGKHWE